MKRTKGNRSLALIAIVFLAFLAFARVSSMIGVIPATYASSSVVQVNQAYSSITSSGSTMVSLTSVSVGDVIVVGVAYLQGTTVSMPTDTLGSSFAQAVSFSNSGGPNAVLYYATAESGGSDSVSVPWTNSCYPLCASSVVVYAFDVSGVTVSGLSTATGSGETGLTGGTLTTTSSVSFQSGAFVLGLGDVFPCYDFSGNSCVFSSGNPSFQSDSVASSEIQPSADAEYSTSLTSSSTNFPIITDASFSAWSEVGIALNPLPTIPTPEFPLGGSLALIIPLAVLSTYLLLRKGARVGANGDLASPMPSS